MSAAWNGPIVAALVALVMAKYFADSIVGVGPFGDLGVLAASAAVLAVAVAVAAVQAAAATVSVPDVAAFVAVVVVVVVAAAVRTAAVVVNDDVVLAVDVVHAAVGFGFVAVLVVHSVAVVWVGIDVAAVVFEWASRIVAADAGNGEQIL